MIPMIATAARQPITLLLPPDSEAPATTTVVMDRCVYGEPSRGLPEVE